MESKKRKEKKIVMNDTGVWHPIMLRVFIVFTMKRKGKALMKEKDRASLQISYRVK